MDLRKRFFQELSELAKADKDIVLLTGDLGYSFYEDFQKEFPTQFINVGCIEQSMVGIAAGLALAGKKPYVYSGTIFLLMRTYEQIRVDVAYPNLDVHLIGTRASGFLGFTHNLGEQENENDLLKNLPNLRQSYPEEANLKETLLLPGPIYIRL